MNFKFLYGLSILFSLMLVSCEANIDLNNISGEVSLNPSLIVPLGSANVKMGQIVSFFNSQNIVATDGTEIYFQDFDSTEFKYRDLNLINNSQELYKEIYISPDNSILYQPDTSLPEVTEDDFLDLGLNQNPAEERVDSVVIGSATFNVRLDISSDLLSIKPSDVLLTIEFPERKLRNLDGSATILNYRPSSFGQIGTVSVSNILLNVSKNASGIPVQLKVALKTNSKAVLANQDSKVICSLKLNQLTYKVAYGYFEPDKTASKIIQRKIDLKKNIPDGLLKFANPKVDITAVSNVGAYLRFQLDYAKAFVSDNSSVAPIYAWFDGHTTNSASEVFDKKPALPGEWITKKLQTLDKNRGETDQLFQTENTADILEYKFSASIDKELTNADPTANFITPDATVKVYINTTIPFQFNAGSNYSYTDSIYNINKIILSTLDQYSKNNINSASLILNISNGLPVDAELDVYFLDGAGNKILTDLNVSDSITSGNVDAQGIVKAGNETNQTKSIYISKDLLEQLRNAQILVYKVKLTGENENSKIYIVDYNTFSVQFGLFVNGNLNANL